MTPEVPIEAPIVDAHAHIFQRDMPVSRGAWHRPDYGFSAEQYLQVLDDHGVHFGLIAGISIYGLYNDYMLEALRKHRRLRGTANVAPTTDRYQLERLKQDGIVGVRLQLTRRQALPDLADDDYQLLFRRLADLDMHVEAVIEGPRWPEVLPALQPSGVKIVIDHFGHADPSAGTRCAGFQYLLKAAEQGRIWVKLAAAYRLTWATPGQPRRDPRTGPLAHELAQALLKHLGTERLLWGSDCPFVGHEAQLSFQDSIRELAEWVPEPIKRRQISNTALKLLFS